MQEITSSIRIAWISVIFAFSCVWKLWTFKCELCTLRLTYLHIINLYSNFWDNAKPSLRYMWATIDVVQWPVLHLSLTALHVSYHIRCPVTRATIVASWATCELTYTLSSDPCYNCRLLSYMRATIYVVQWPVPQLSLPDLRVSSHIRCPLTRATTIASLATCELTYTFSSDPCYNCRFLSYHIRCPVTRATSVASGMISPTKEKGSGFGSKQLHKIQNMLHHRPRSSSLGHKPEGSLLYRLYIYT